MIQSSEKILIWKLGLAGLISAADNWIISPVLPAIAADFDTTIVQTGMILTTYMIPYGLMQPIYGFLSDSRGKAKILQVVVGGLTLGTFGCALAKSLLLLCFWRFITGFFAAGIIAVSLALIGDTVPPIDRQKYVGMFMGIVFLGQGGSVGVGGIVAEYTNWRIIFIFLAIASIGVLALLYKLPQEIICSNEHKFFPEIKKILFTSKKKYIFPLALITGFLLLGMYSYLGAFLHEIAGLDYFQVGIIVMFYGIACFIAGGRVGKVVGKIGMKSTIIVGSCFSLLSTLLLMIFPWWQTGWLATVSLGIGYIYIQSTLAAIAFDVTTKAKGLPSAMIGLGLFGGGGLGTLFGGWLLSQSSYFFLWLTFSVGIIFFMCITANLEFFET